MLPQTIKDEPVQKPEEEPVVPSSSPAVNVEEIHTESETAEKSTTTKRAVEKKEEPSPLLLDPYEFDQCTITIVYTRIGDKQATVSVHSHKDDPSLKTFPLVEVPLVEPIACVIEKVLEIWPDSKVSVTMVLLPKGNEAERQMVISIRAGNDTPVILAGIASQFPLPLPITALLEELKELLPNHAMQKIEKEAKERSKATSKAASAKVSSGVSPTPAKPVPATVDGKTQMTLF
jgi:hypothetical protein